MYAICWNIWGFFPLKYLQEPFHGKQQGHSLNWNVERRQNHDEGDDTGARDRGQGQARYRGH